LIQERLRNFTLNPDATAYRTMDDCLALADSLSDMTSVPIGESRDGCPLIGFEFGTGERLVSVIAGCHADEPVGPMTAQMLFIHLSENFPHLLESFRFRVIPQMNPDGAKRNRPWFEPTLKLDTYLNHVIRELPGDDIEFGFGRDGDERPECKAMQSFLGTSGPYAAHFSLHGLGFAEGAWCLICKEWGEKAKGFMDTFAQLCEAVDFPQYDIDRKGDKGFYRIGKGYTTTPHSVPMKKFFMAQNDPETAAKIKPTSMEYIQSLGGDPLCIVSELPLFHIGVPSEDLDHLTTNAFKDELNTLRAKHPELTSDLLKDLCTQYKVSSTPLELQVRLQTGMIVLALQELL
jgi:hypothetical protein